MFAENEAQVVASNLAHAITGEGTPKRFDGSGQCFIETDDHKAGFGKGNFYAEPAPQIRLRSPSRLQHMGKVAFEKYWVFEWL